jgi:hypothetical protein
MAAMVKDLNLTHNNPVDTAQHVTRLLIEYDSRLIDSQLYADLAPLPSATAVLGSDNRPI